MFQSIVVSRSDWESGNYDMTNVISTVEIKHDNEFIKTTGKHGGSAECYINSNLKQEASY